MFEAASEDKEDRKNRLMSPSISTPTLIPTPLPFSPLQWDISVDWLQYSVTIFFLIILFDNTVI